jgi:hypothetical protein
MQAPPDRHHRERQGLIAKPRGLRRHPRQRELATTSTGECSTRRTTASRDRMSAASSGRRRRWPDESDAHAYGAGRDAHRRGSRWRRSRLQHRSERRARPGWAHMPRAAAGSGARRKLDARTADCGCCDYRQTRSTLRLRAAGRSPTCRFALTPVTSTTRALDRHPNKTPDAVTGH